MNSLESPRPRNQAQSISSCDRGHVSAKQALENTKELQTDQVVSNEFVLHEIRSRQYCSLSCGKLTRLRQKQHTILNPSIFLVPNTLNKLGSMANPVSSEAPSSQRRPGLRFVALEFALVLWVLQIVLPHMRPYPLSQWWFSSASEANDNLHALRL